MSLKARTETQVSRIWLQPGNAGCVPWSFSFLLILCERKKSLIVWNRIPSGAGSCLTLGGYKGVSARPCPAHCWALGLSPASSREEVAHGPLAGHLLDTLVWLELEMTLPFTRKQIQKAFDTKDRAASECAASRSHANISELWVPSDFQGSLL